MKNQIKNAGSILIGVLLLDQLTKTVVNTTYTFGFIRLIPVQNTGGVLGLFSDSNTIFIGLSVAVLGLLLYIRREVKPWWTVPALLGAGLGNLVDRIRFGYVQDFISVGYFPVFNVADAVITLCAVVILWYEFQNSSKS